MKISCFIFVARSDASFVKNTLPPLCKMANKAGCTITVVLDASKPNGVLGESLRQSDLSIILELLEEIKLQHPFEIEILSPVLEEVQHLSKTHLGKSYRETHCFRGYPIHGSIRQFHKDDSDYILHLDCDMIFYEEEGFSWITAGARLMEKNEDILCVLPRGGPPAMDGKLYQGTTQYKEDNSRSIYLFKNFTSRHYLVHRKKFLELLPMKPLWLSWREPLKSIIYGKGKMLCWESIVEFALSKSNFWRADLMNTDAWSIHPGDRSDKFHKLLPILIDTINEGTYPNGQAGYFDLKLDCWEKLINDES